jgi:hypothetical protein
MHDSRAADTCARRASCSCTLFVNYSPADLTRLGASGAPYKNQLGLAAVSVHLHRLPFQMKM